jgi:polyhydroxybutyrate depolymerase
MSDRIAAIAPVSGHLFVKEPALKRPVPMLFIVGDSDPLNPLSGGEATNPWGVGKRITPPMIDSVRAWAIANGSQPDDASTSIHGVATIAQYSADKPDRQITFITLAGQGHEWAGKPRVLPERLTGPSVKGFDATDAVWDFFSTHARRSPRQ